MTKKPKDLEGEVISVTGIVPYSDLQKQTPAIVKRAQSLAVTNQESYVGAGEILKSIKNLEAQIIDRFIDAKSKAFQAHKAITALEKELLAGPQQARKVVEGKLAFWRDEQERVRVAEQQRLQDQLEAEAEKARAKEAAKLQKAGKTKEAKALLKEEIIVDTVEIPSTVPKVEGLTVQIRWGFEIIDATLIPREYLVPDETKIRKVVFALRGDTNIPGIKPFEKTITVGR